MAVLMDNISCELTKACWEMNFEIKPIIWSEDKKRKILVYNSCEKVHLRKEKTVNVKFDKKKKLNKPELSNKLA